MPEWATRTLGDVCAELTVGHVGSMASQYVPRGVPFLRSQNVRTGRLDLDGLKHISLGFHQQLRKSQLRPGDIVIVRTGEPGAAAVIPQEFKELNCSDLVIARPAADIDSRFLCYAINATAGQFVASRLVGAVQQHFNVGSARRVPLRIPPPRTQRAIAAMLGALDGKIAVNDRIVAVGDELTSTLLDDILAHDDELPEVSLADVAVVNRQKVTPTPGGQLRYIDISSVSQGRVEWPSVISWDEAPGRARRGVSPGDTIWSTVRPGRKSFALILDDDPQLVVSTGFAVLTPSRVGPAFLYEVTKRDEFVQYLVNVAEGSAYPAARADRFEKAAIPLPSRQHLERFETVSMEIRRRGHAAQRESRALAKLRDALLPGLMAGEIRVRDAERAVGEAT